MAKATKKKSEFEQVQATALMERVSKIKPEDVTNDFAASTTRLNEMITGASLLAVQKLNVIKDLDATIQLQKDELAQLHSIQVGAETLEALEAEINETRSQWVRDQDAYNKRLDDMDLQREQQRARAEESYQYTLTNSRKSAEDLYQRSCQDRDRANKLKQEELVRDWEKRSNEWKVKEEEFKTLQTQVAGIDTRVAAEVKKAEAIVGNAVKKEHDQLAALRSKDHELALANARTEVNATAGMLKRAEEQVKSLTTELQAANARAQDIASKAMDAASCRQALEAVQRANENAGTTTTAQRR